MKKVNSTIILLIILLVLAGGYFGYQYYQKQQVQTEDQLLFGNFDISQITKIEIASQFNGEGKLTVLEKRDDQWLVASADYAPADPEAVSVVFVSLPQVKIKELVSANPEKQAEYRVGPADLHIKIYQSENLLFDFYAGKNGPIPSSGYFRWEGNGNVYLISENFQTLFFKADWKKVIETAAE